ncbi:ABC transporter substrate-binding protein [Salsuginibacillus kocurii]|uniref:ABC transporter substrate-binding protein n=1 Tax=Salsuginibacillus kocurii TaxID=427078 RepID=UPI00036CA468|nr:iron-siderophore ABC transporter substrate-binding protein [Salsuginibacillus kocurii]
MKKFQLTICAASVLVLAACGADEQEEASTAEGEEGMADEASADENTDEDTAEGTRTIEHAMGEAEVPEEPERIVALTGDALEALLSVGITPVGATEAMGEDEWYPHLEDQMEGVTNVGEMGEPDLEAIQALEPDLILGNQNRQEESYEVLNEIAPTVFTETYFGTWKEDFELYTEAANEAEAGEEVMAEWEERAFDLSDTLAAEEKLDQEVGVVRFTAGQGRYFYNDSYAVSILQELGFERPELHDEDEGFVENITQERIPEMDADLLFYFVLDDGDGEGYEFADEWMETDLFQRLEAYQEDQVHEVNQDYWNMTYGILSADYVLEDVEELVLNED